MSCKIHFVNEDLKNQTCHQKNPNQCTCLQKQCTCLQNEKFRIIIQPRDEKLIENNEFDQNGQIQSIDCTCCAEYERLLKLIQQNHNIQIFDKYKSVVNELEGRTDRNHAVQNRISTRPNDGKIRDRNCEENLQKSRNKNDINHQKASYERVRNIGHEKNESIIESHLLLCDENQQTSLCSSFENKETKSRKQEKDYNMGDYMSYEADENSQTDCSCCLENERLSMLIQQKDETMLQMITEFEMFIDKLCAENRKLEQKLIDAEEEACGKITNSRKENRELKKQIEKLEEDIICCRRQAAKFLTSLDVDSYKKTIEEQNLDIKRNDKIIKTLTNRLEKIEESHDSILEENEVLKERLERVKLVVNRAKLDVVEYCREIKKYDDMTLNMENQISKYQECLFKLQDRIREEHMDKKALEDLSEELNQQLLEEKAHHINLETDLKIMREKYEQCESSLMNYKKKLDETTRELTCYKENLGHLRKILEAKKKSGCRKTDCKEKQFADTRKFTESCDPIQAHVVSLHRKYTEGVLGNINSKPLAGKKRKNYTQAVASRNPSTRISNQNNLVKKPCKLLSIKTNPGEHKSTLSCFLQKKFNTNEQSLNPVTYIIRDTIKKS